MSTLRSVKWPACPVEESKPKVSMKDSIDRLDMDGVSRKPASESAVNRMDVSDEELLGVAESIGSDGMSRLKQFCESKLLFPFVDRMDSRQFLRLLLKIDDVFVRSSHNLMGSSDMFSYYELIRNHLVEYSDFSECLPSVVFISRDLLSFAGQVYSHS
jgi:hypothetical protein